MLKLGISSPEVSFFFWAAAITPIFLAIERAREGDWKWATIYAISALTLAACGILWPMLPNLISNILEARADQIFGLGILVLSVIYGLARRRWVKFGDRRFVSGFGEGVVVFAFLTLALSPLFRDELIAEIFVRQQPIFALSGVLGLVLLLIDYDRKETEGRHAARLERLMNEDK